MLGGWIVVWSRAARRLRAGRPVRDGWVWLVILAVAALPRFALASMDFFHHPDEIFQYLEPAYGILTGDAVRTWEYREGIRGWLLPELIAGPLWLARVLARDPGVAVMLVRMVFATASLAIVAAGMAMAWRISRLHALVTGLVLATSFELIFFAPRLLSEAVATDCLIVAALLITGPTTARRAVAAGALLGFAFLLRFQLAPMIATLAVLTLGLRRRAWGWTLLGGLAALGLGCLADWAQGAPPLYWIVENVRQNFVAKRSEHYGVETWSWYLTTQAALWSVLTPVVLALIALGARHRAVLILTVAAAVNIAFHALVPHKEYRFIFPSVAMLLIAAAIGSGDVLAWVRGQRWRMLTAGGLAALWAGVSAANATGPLPRNIAWNAASMSLWRYAHAKTDLCGIASPNRRPEASLALIGRSVPVYMFAEPEADRAMRSNVRAFNLLFARPAEGAALADAGFRAGACFPRGRAATGPGDATICAFVRSGGCSRGDPSFLENTVRARLRE